MGILVIIALAMIQPLVTADAPAGAVSPRTALALPATFVPILGRTSSADPGHVPVLPSLGLRLRAAVPAQLHGVAARAELAFGGAKASFAPLGRLFAVYLI